MPTYTQNQIKAIEHGGHDVLVSASAGSGKTTVLVERILHQLELGVPLSQMLIVTFTTAATADMKLKIQKKLKEAVDQRPDSAVRRFLITQLALSNAAPIMTLDAFCLQIVQQYYYAIDLEPGFRLLSDEVERSLMAEQVWGDLCEVLYAGDHRDEFLALADNFSAGVDDRGLQDAVFALCNYANTTTDAAGWLAQLAEPYRPRAYAEQFATQVWPSLRQAVAACVNALTQLDEALDLADPGLRSASEHLHTTIAPLQAALALEAPTYAQAREALTAVSWPNWRGSKTETPEAKDLRASTNDQRKALQADFEKTVLAQLVMPEADLDRVLTATYPLMQTLSMACAEFQLAFAAEKASRHLQDFGDIAHNALTILHADDPQTKRPIAENFQANFAQVFVDEYQDINPLQEALLTAISRTAPGNRFMVGDIKQSIYGFRLADPRLFLAKYKRFGEVEAEGERLVLAENFRSSRNVLDFTNLIFSQIMDETVGEMAYGKDEQLQRATFNAPADFAPDTEILLNVDPEASDTTTEGDDGESQADMDRAQQQARLVIARIQALVTDPNAWLYTGKAADGTWQRHHPTYKDITILVRSRTNNITIQSVFAQENVPIIVKDAQNYFKTTELMTMLSLLRLIDNPRQEVALVAVLRSPMVGLTADDLAQIRLAAPDASFDTAYTAFLAAEETAAIAATQAQVRAFDQQLTALRAYARDHELVDLIWHCYDVFGYLDFVGGLPGGKQRQANLRALASRAAGYEAGGFRGLFAFIRFIEAMQKQDKDLAMPVTVDADADAVSLMTIHGSKGLEFPVVFLMGADKRFNGRNLSANPILTPAGVGIKWRDPDSQLTFTLPQYVAAQATKRRQELAEEMRLLYVALTRAEQHLFIVANAKDADQPFLKWQGADSDTHQVLPASMREKATSFMDWIAMALVRLPQFGSQQHIATFGANVQVHTQVQAPPVAPIASKQSVPPVLDVDLDDWFNWQYPHLAETQTTGFQSVTEIKRAQSEDPDNSELRRAGAQLGGARFTADFATPAFAQTRTQVSATAVGTATHLVLQRLDWTQPAAAAIAAAIAALVAAQQVPPEVAAKIDQAQLVAFCQSPLGQLIQRNSDSLQREVAFSLLLPAKRVFAAVSDDTADILVHGMLDGYIATPAGLILFDYKTDRVPAAELRPRYTTQLQLYAEALAQLQQRPVVKRYLVSLFTNQLVEVAKPADE